MKTEELKQLSDQYRQELKEYLEDPTASFAVGFQLMIRFSIKVSLIHMIGAKRNQPRMREKMDYELKKIAERDVISLSPYADKAVMKRVHPAVGALIDDNKAAKKAAAEIELIEAIPEKEKEAGEKELHSRLVVVTGNEKITPEEMPLPILKEWQKARRCYHLESHYHNKMKVVVTDAERAECLKLAKEYEDLNKAAWAAIDQWAVEGKPKAAEKDTEAPKLPADVAKAIGSAKSYISREAKKLDKKEGKQLEHLRDMLTGKIKVLTDNKIAIPAPQLELLQKHGLIG